MFHPQPQEPPAGLGGRIHIEVYDLHSITLFQNGHDIALRVPTPTGRIAVQVNIGRHGESLSRVEVGSRRDWSDILGTDPGPALLRFVDLSGIHPSDTLRELWSRLLNYVLL